MLYYDCAPYEGFAAKPVGRGMHHCKGNDTWLRDLARRDFFGVRRGVLKFRGWRAKSSPLPPRLPAQTDFEPTFEQKGVDMRIGLDVATFSGTHAVDRLVLATGDTDCIPAMKHARKAGLQIVLVSLPNHRCTPELLEHADVERHVTWPSQPIQTRPASTSSAAAS